MQQKDINDILYNLLSGDLTEEDERELENWLNHSAENRRRYEDLMNSDDFVSSYHAFHNIDKEKAWQQFRKQKIVRKPAILVPLLRVAAVVVFVIIGSYWYMTRDTSTPPVLTEEVLSAITRAEQSGRNEAVLTINGKQRVVTAIPQDLDEEDMEGLNKGESVTTLPSTVETVEGAATLVTRHDKEFWLTLDDGTRVHLNYNTSFTYPVHFNGKTREVELSGEAFFFVAKDQKRPFIVHTPQGDVRVYGTEFHVKTSSADREQGAVVLVKGSVGFTLKDGMETVIKPGQEISYSGEHPTSVTLRNVDVTPFIAWNTGVFVFENSTLEQLMNVLAQWYSVEQVVYEDDNLRTIHFTGSLERYGDIKNVMQAITSVCDVEMIRQGETVVIRKKQK